MLWSEFTPMVLVFAFGWLCGWGVERQSWLDKAPFWKTDVCGLCGRGPREDQ